MADDSAEKRSLLRRAFDFVTGRNKKTSEFSIGPVRTANLHDLLASSDDDEPPLVMINVSIDLRDSTYERINEIDEAIATALEEKGVGKWIGCGTFSDSQGNAIRDFDYEVSDEDTAFTVIRDTLVRENAPRSSRVAWKGGVVFPMRAEM